MSNPQDPQVGNASRIQEARKHGRRKLSGMAYVELAQDNGGTLLNLGEGGLAVHSALPLSSTDFPELRFQLPQMQGWLRASGRVAWMSKSKKEAGIQFLDLREPTRTQIRAWLENEESSAPESVKARGPAEALPARSQPGEGSAASAFAPYSLSSRPRTGSAGPQSAPPGTESPMQEELPGFRFNDYSMFSADPRASELLLPVARPKTRWAGRFLLVVVLCSLSFVSGVIVQQRGDVDRLLAYVGVTAPDAAQPQVAPVATTPAGGPLQPAASPLTDNATTPSETLQTQPANDAQHAQNQQGASPAQPAVPDVRKSAPEATPVAAAPVGAPMEKPEAPASTPTPSSKNKIAAPGSVENSATSAAKPKAPKRGNFAAPAADTSIDHGPSILVSAPAPGSPPFWVNLPEESVNASPTVAITAKRSIQVPPRAEAAAARSERVIIGRLIAHSDPFYPLEARREKIEGSVTLQAVVGRTGQVLRVTPVSGPPVLTTAAVAALRDWRYEPTFIDGDPVETQTYVTMVFRAH